MRLRASATFDAPPERVWEVLSDWDLQPSWMPDVAALRLVGSERELGALLEVRTKVFGIPAVTDVVMVTAWEPPRRLGVEHRRLVSGRGVWLLEPAGTETRFAWLEELRMPPPLLGEIALHVYAPVQAANIRRSIHRLRLLLAKREPHV